mgnify:CR=1 FL=1|tara:strand:- start:1106 stop:1600 length:495 start_codon:yes stop_codon:yes gene_type:complete
MTIIVKNKDTLIFREFRFKCCIGKNGFSKKKIEGDKKTPVGKYNLGKLFFRKDRKPKPQTSLKILEIKKNMLWCNDVNSKKYYNKLINFPSKLNGENLFRNDYKYDFFIPIKYNFKKVRLGHGSAIFIHLTKNFKPTAGCIGLMEKDFLILAKLINRDTQIKIY